MLVPPRTSIFGRAYACSCYSSSRTAAISSCRHTAWKCAATRTTTYFWNALTKPVLTTSLQAISKHFPQFWKKTKIITSREFISLAAPHLSS